MSKTTKKSKEQLELEALEAELDENEDEEDEDEDEEDEEDEDEEEPVKKKTPVKSKQNKKVQKTPVAKRRTEKTQKGTKKVSTRISKSGKYTSLRHMMEVLLVKNPKLAYDDTVKLVQAEYPNRMEHWNVKHFAWFRTQIVTNGDIKNREMKTPKKETPKKKK